MPEDLNVLVEPYEEPQFPFDRFRDVIMRHERVHELLGELRDPIISDPEVLGREKDQRSPFRVTVFDQSTNRAVEVRGRLDDFEQLDVRPSAFRPNPTADELQRAAEIVRNDPGFEQLARSDDVILYQPMPPLADLELDDGTSVRRPTVGIFDPAGSPRHQIVAVDIGQRVVDWTPHGVDGPTDDDCESHIPDRIDSATDPSGPDKVRVRVIRNGEELWNLIVVHPRASTPTTYGKGSGVELRFVRYKGRLVMWKAHVPILNVLYDDGTSYRDWQNAETKFQADGSDPVGPGFRVCTSPPATILEAGTDAGNFQGVAFWYESGELRIVSELQAGWYRYISDWRLCDDGVIKPRFGFAATKNPRTCLVHHHHAYWRLDFDIEGAGNDVVQQTGRVFPGRPRWTNIVREAARKRSVFTSWRVLDKATGRGYRIFPGLADGSADAFGVADLWFLRYHGDELDDGVSVIQAPAAQTQIQIGKYVNGESIDGTDVVVWYAGHFVHDENHPSPATGHIVGPELWPVNWS